MKALDLGAGWDPQRWFPGADVAENNFCDPGDIPEEEKGGRQFFVGFFGEDILPVPDKTYDLIWYSYGWYTVNMSARRKVAREITRVAKDTATLVLRDYCSIYDTVRDVDINLTAKQWRRIVETCFPDWNFDGFYIELSSSGDVIATYDDEFCVVAILTRNWG